MLRGKQNVANYTKHGGAGVMSAGDSRSTNKFVGVAWGINIINFVFCEIFPFIFLRLGYWVNVLEIGSVYTSFYEVMVTLARIDAFLVERYM